MKPPRIITLDQAERRDLLPLRHPRSVAAVQFHVTVTDGHGSALFRVDSTNQRRAEQFALGFARNAFFKHNGPMEVVKTELVD